MARKPKMAAGKDEPPPAALFARKSVKGRRPQKEEEPPRRYSQSPVNPSGPVGSPPAPDPPAQGDPTARDAARTVLKDCEQRWQTLRSDWGKILGDHLTQTFSYYESALSDTSSAGDVIKDSYAQGINGYGALRALYDASYRFCSPTKTDG